MKNKTLWLTAAVTVVAVTALSGQAFGGEVANLDASNEQALAELNSSIDNTINAGFYYGKRIAGGAGLIMMMIGSIFRQNPTQTLVGLGTFAGALGLPKLYEVFLSGSLLPL